MDKNWLIRTTQNKILGPISKEKLIEFIEKGSLTQSDEVSAGNGYWFFLHEQELVDRFIVGNETQGFNPISECKTVLCRKQRRVEDHAPAQEETQLDSDTNNTMVIGRDLLSQLSSTADEGDEGDNDIPPVSAAKDEKQMLPDASDLEFPDIDGEYELPTIELEESYSVGEGSHQTAIITPDLEAEDEAFQGKLPSNDDLEYPSFDEDEVQVMVQSEEESQDLPEAPVEEELVLASVPEKEKMAATPRSIPPQKPMRQKNTKTHEAKRVEVLKTNRSDRYLFYVFFIMISLVAYAIYFYYSKISNHRPVDVGEELSSLFIPSARAQDAFQKKNIIIDSFALPEGKFALNQGIIGAQLSYSPLLAISDKCVGPNEFYFLLNTFLADPNDTFPWSASLQACPNFYSIEAKVMLEAAQKPFQERGKFVLERKAMLSSDDLNVIRQIEEMKKSRPLLKQVLAFFNEYIEALNSKPSTAELYRLNEKVHAFSGQVKQQSILALLMEVVAALSVDNQAWAKRSFSLILQRNLLQIAFHLDATFFESPEERKRYENNMRLAMRYTVERLHDQMLAKLAINYFAVFDQSDVTLDMLKKLNSEWSLVEIREKATERINGKFFFIPWFYILQSRAQDQEIERFVRTHLNAKLVEQLGIDLLPIILKYLPLADDAEKQLVMLLKESFSHPSPFARYMIIQALKSPQLYKALSPLPQEYRGANFQLERREYRQLLEEKGIVHFSLFNLVRIGEIKRPLLWWLIL